MTMALFQCLMHLLQLGELKYHMLMRAAALGERFLGREQRIL